MIGRTKYDSETVLKDVIDYIEDQYDFKWVSLCLHLHSPVGHVNVIVSKEKPTEFSLESSEYDLLESLTYSGHIGRAYAY